MPQTSPRDCPAPTLPWIMVLPRTWPPPAKRESAACSPPWTMPVRWRRPHNNRNLGARSSSVAKHPLMHQARKRFGQNFLHDQGVISRIVRSINPKPGEALVEIGPCLGALTELLLEATDG